MGSSTFLDDYGLIDNFSDNWFVVGGLNNSLLDGLMDLSSFHFFVGLVGVSLVNDWDVFLLNDGLVLLVDDWLVVLVDVLFDDHWLMVLMNHVLMVFVNNVLVVLYDDILVMLVDNILVNFFHDGCIDVGLNVSSKLVLLNYFTFISLLVDCFLFVLDHDWLFVNFLNNNVSSSDGLGSASKASFSVSVSSAANGGSSRGVGSSTDVGVSVLVLSDGDVFLVVNVG